MTITTVKDPSMRRRALLNTLSNYLGQIVMLGTGFVLTPFILHRIGASSYGLWLVVGSIVAYGGLLDLGIATAVIKYVAEYRALGEHEQLDRFVTTTLVLYICLGLIAFLLSVVLAQIFPALFNVPIGEYTTTTRLILLMGLSLGISIPGVMTNAVLRGLQRFELANLIAIIGTLLSAAATIIVLLLGYGLIAMVAVNIPISLIMQIPAVWFVRLSAPELGFSWRRISWQQVRTVFSYSWSLFLGQLAGQFQTKSDEIVIGGLLPISSVTPYALARRLSEIPQALSSQFMKILLPLASTLHAENDQNSLRAMYISSTRMALASFLPISCSIVVLARPLLTVWVGAEYADGAPIVLILSIASLIDTIQWPAGAILQGMARHRLLAFISICSGLVNLLLSIALVRRFGVIGVALGTLIPTTIESLIFMMPYAMRIIGVTARESLMEICFPAFVPAIPMIFVLYGLREYIAPSSLISIAFISATGILVYILGYLSFRTNTIERQACQDVALGTARMAKSLLRRS